MMVMPLRYGMSLRLSNKPKNKQDWDYSFTEYLRKAVEIAAKNLSVCSDPICTVTEAIEDDLYCMNQSCRDLHRYKIHLLCAETECDFYAGSLKELKHLIQYDDKPNSDFKSPRVELYKISVTFRSKGIFQGISSLRGIRA